MKKSSAQPPNIDLLISSINRSILSLVMKSKAGPIFLDRISMTTAGGIMQRAILF
jgi:hypothetical protein